MTEIPNALTPSGQVVDEVVDYVVDAITIGTVTASEPGEAPSLTLTKTVGGNYVLDAVIPRGDPAPPGLPGESAYQIWVDQGNIGTEEDFLADLVGPTGTIEDVMAANIGDATAAGRALLTAADAEAQKDLLDIVASVAAADITDATTAGAAILTAADAAAQRLLLELGNVANLAPEDLPVSTATQDAIDTALAVPPVYLSTRQWTATAGQTAFTASGFAYTPPFCNAFLNGAKLVPGVDVDVTSGTSVVLLDGAAVGDILDVVAFDAFQIADAVPTVTFDAALALKASTADLALKASTADLAALAAADLTARQIALAIAYTGAS